MLILLEPMGAGVQSIWKADLIQAAVLFCNIPTGLQHSIMRTGPDGLADIVTEITLGYTTLAPMAELGGRSTFYRAEAITGRRPDGSTRFMRRSIVTGIQKKL